MLLKEGYPWNNEPLLNKAVEIGNILSKAFNTPTGIPYGTVNLENGGSIPPKESKITSLATAGTFIIEFGVLSKLTNNPFYENIAKDSLKAIWSRRSELNLLGNHIDITDGKWTSVDTSIGGNSDSFYEYLLKGSILFGDNELGDIFEKSYSSIMKHVARLPWYPQVHMNTGQITSATFESLQAFWPGLQVLIGDIEKASVTMHAFQSIWQEYGFVPEVFDLSLDTVSKGREQYPLRPEMAESLYYLYSATKDPIWLQYGREIINSLEKYAKVPCGFAAIENVKSKILRDHMDSFFLSETCKYLYLLFTPDHPISNSQKYIFNTEGHPFPMRYDWLRSTNPLQTQCPNLPLSIQISNNYFQPFNNHLKRNEDLLKLQKILQFNEEEIHSKEELNQHEYQEEEEKFLTNEIYDDDDSSDLSSSSNDLKKKITEKLKKLKIDDYSSSLFLLEVLEPENISGMNEIVFLAQFGSHNIENFKGFVKPTFPKDACGNYLPASENLDLYGKIAWIERGTCEFTEKVRNAEIAGAIGAIVVNNIPKEDGQRISMSGDSSTISIPSVFVSHSFGKKISSSLKEDELFVQVIESEEFVDVEDDTVIVDLSSIDTSDPQAVQEQLIAIMQSLNVEDSENISRRLSDYLSSHAITDDDELDVNLALNHSGRIIGKQMHGCVDGEC